MNEEPFENVDRVCYLVSMIDQRRNIEKDAQARKGKTHQVFAELKKCKKYACM